MKTTSRDGTTLSYRKSGQGPALILIDGALCSTALGPMTDLLPLMAEHFTVYHYDRRGRGESTDASGYSATREVEDLSAMIEVAGGSAMVVGMSSGAALAAMAAAEGSKISKLVLCEPPFITDSNAKAEHQRKVKVLNDLLKQDKRNEAVAYFQVDIVGIPRFVPWILRLTPMWPKLKAVAPTLRYDMEVLGDGGIPSGLSKIKVPTAVVGGGKSAPFLQNAVNATAAAIPGAQKIVLPDQSHNFVAKKVAPELIKFLRA